MSLTIEWRVYEAPYASHQEPPRTLPPAQSAHGSLVAGPYNDYMKHLELIFLPTIK